MSVSENLENQLHFFSSYTVDFLAFGPMGLPPCRSIRQGVEDPHPTRSAATTDTHG